MRSPLPLHRLSRPVLIMALCAAVPAVHAAEPVKRTPARAGQTATQAPAGDQFVDGIAAIVNKDVITLREVNVATAEARRELASQKIQAPNDRDLQRQVLQRLIMDRVQQQEAARMNIRVTDEQVDQAINGIAQRNRITIAAMQAEIKKSGTTWDAYRDGLRKELQLDRMRQRAVDSTIVISDAEVDAYLKEQQRQGGGGMNALGQGQAAPAPVQQQAAPAAPAQSGPAMLALAQILVRVPEGTSGEQLTALRKKAEGLLARVKAGDDFAAVAAASSDGPEALQGGVMGGRTADGWPDLFLQAVANVAPGQTSGIIQSGNGFHILKVLDRRSPGAQQAQRGSSAPQQQAPQPQQQAARAPQGPMQVTQTHARHILIKTSTVMSDTQARQRLEQLRQRITTGGENMAELARQYSNDGTAPQGGDLGWLNPGETVPAFEQAMNALQPGQISQPIQSPFGWHLIQVIERREQDIADEYQRMQARQVLFERRAQPAMEDWLSQLRDRAFIDNRLEREDAIKANNS